MIGELVRVGALFAWLLALHPGSAGRTYAAYGAVYVTVPILWLALFEGQHLDAWDIVGAAVSLLAMAIVVLGHVRSA